MEAPPGPSSDLDQGTLHYLFATQLDGRDLAACAKVCRAWRAVAASEALWQQKVTEIEPHPHLRRDDLLPAFGGSHRRYFAWRWPLLRGPVGCILVESNEEELDAATYPVPAGGAQSSARRSWPTSVPHPPRHNLEVVSCTLAPVGPLLAYSGIDTRQQQAVVVVAHARSGRLRFSFVLGDPHPPFFLQWSACGTRLLCLSNWQGGMVALRALDLGPLLLPPQEQERLGLGGNFEVLLCTARPLFLSASPTSTRVLWHGNGLNLGLCDAATNVSEDGSEHDCFFVNPALCRAQTPQWVTDAAGADLLLMPIMDAQQGQQQAQQEQGQGPTDSGVLVLAPLAAIAEALEAEGSRLSRSLLLSLSQPVAPFSSARNLHFAANRDCSMVAWSDGGNLSVKFQATGTIHRIWPRPPAEEAQRQQSGGGGSGGGGSATLARSWDRAVVPAMQWSPDGRRLVFLLFAGPAITRPRFRFVVFDAPAVVPAPTADPHAAPGWLGSLTVCSPFNPTAEFLDRNLPFADQYLQAMRLWDPTSTAFCFAARGRFEKDVYSEQANAYVQPVPRPPEPGADGSSSSSAAAGEAAPLALHEAPPPTWLAPGYVASWSGQ